MRPQICSALVLSLVLLTSGSAQQAAPKGSAKGQGSPAFPPAAIMSVTLPDKIDWRKGGTADRATLYGDPSKPGVYVELVRWHAGNMSRPHSHRNARYITVIEGTWWLGSGPEYNPASTYPATKGTFVVHHPNQLHYDGAKDEDCVIQIVGMGPE